jgi:hypothetical protein
MVAEAGGVEENARRVDREDEAMGARAAGRTAMRENDEVRADRDAMDRCMLMVD